MELPVTVNKYQLSEELGKGAFAIVYKARQIETGEIVAVKKMKKMTKQDAEMVKKEIGIMKDLNHKNIVQYLQDFRDKGQWYIVLEYCGKGDMEQFKKKVGKIPEAHCKLFVRGILEALVQLHKKKIAHRDLKLANILINDDYKLKLADFGFSKDYQSGYLKSFCGTPLSMAPQVLQREKYNERCDVWSLGVLTFMMLYNRPPYFPTKSDGMGITGITNAVTLRNHKFDENVQVSKSGKKFINDCLKKKMDERPTTAELLKHEWFDSLMNNNISKLRTEMIKISIGSEQDQYEQESKELCGIMLFGVFEEHLKKIAHTMQLNTDIIAKNKAIFDQYYPNNKKIFGYYLSTVLKHLSNLGEKLVIYMLYDSSYKLSIKDIKKYKQFEKELICYIDSINGLPSKEEKVNLEKQIVKFSLAETQILMDSTNDEEITDKMALLKSLCRFVATQYENTMIEVKWGDRADLEKYNKYIYDHLTIFKEDSLLSIINEENVSDDDLESIWLIENHIKETVAKKKNNETEFGKLAMFVLSMPTNFSADKTFQTEKLQLSDSDMWMSNVMNF